MDGWLPIIIMIVLGAAFAGLGVLASQFLGPNNPTPEKLAPYECGVPPVGRRARAPCRSSSTWSR